MVIVKPGVRRLVWLGGIVGTGALVVAVVNGRADGDAASRQVPVSLVSVHQADRAPLASVAAASMPVLSAAAMPPSAVLRVAPVDVSRMQRDIQFAISSDQRGKAGEAARHIQSCMALERAPEKRRQWIEDNRQRFPEHLVSAMRNRHQEMVASCQAVDAAARAQLVPLLRRSLAEGDKGAAAGLVQAMGRDFKPAAEPEVVSALRRDAWDCDRVSLSALASVVNRHPKLLPPNDIGAVRDQQRNWARKSLEAALRAAEGDPRRKAILEQLMASYQPPPEANPTEVARISADIQSRCKAEPSQVSGVRPGTSS